jgi:hypothetical protein
MGFLNTDNYKLVGLLTKEGRNALLSGKLNFKQFGLGDSDVNYLTFLTTEALNIINNPNGTSVNDVYGPPITYSGGTNYSGITIPNVGGVNNCPECIQPTAIKQIKFMILRGDCEENNSGISLNSLI